MWHALRDILHVDETAMTLPDIQPAGVRGAYNFVSGGLLCCEMPLIAAGLLFNSELTKLHWELTGSECNPLSIKRPKLSPLRVQCLFPIIVQQAAPQPKTKLQSVPLKRA